MPVSPNAAVPHHLCLKGAWAYKYEQGKQCPATIDEVFLSWVSFVRNARARQRWCTCPGHWRGASDHCSIWRICSSDESSRRCKGCPFATWWQWPCPTGLGCTGVTEVCWKHCCGSQRDDLALHLYEKYGRMCHEQGLVPLPLSRIHGDIKQLLHHLDFRSRFRRSDLITLINTFHRRRSHAAPNAITEYRPWERTLSLTILASKCLDSQ